MTTAEFADLSAASSARPRMPGSTREELLDVLDNQVEAIRGADD